MVQIAHAHDPSLTFLHLLHSGPGSTNDPIRKISAIWIEIPALTNSIQVAAMGDMPHYHNNSAVI